MPQAAMIEVETLTKRFGATRALGRGLLDRPAGPGAGASRAERSREDHLGTVLTTLLQPDSGRASVAGLDVRKNATVIRSMIGLAGQYATVDELLTGRENLELAGLLYHLAKPVYRRRAQEALERMSLAQAETSSSGPTQEACADVWTWPPA